MEKKFKRLDITVDIVIELLYIDKSGSLRWKERSSKWFISEDQCVKWNSRYSNKKALNCTNKRGVGQGRILDVNFEQGMAIYIIEHGEYPKTALVVPVDYPRHARNPFLSIE